MKKIIILFFLLVNISISYGQRNVYFASVTDSTVNFRRNLSKNSVILNLQDKKIWVLTEKASTNQSLEGVSKSLASGSGGSVSSEDVLSIISDTLSYYLLSDSLSDYATNEIVSDSLANYSRLDKENTFSENQTISKNLTITGDLFLNGNIDSVLTETVSTSDNIIRLNSGETGNGITSGFAGVEIDRGTANNYFFGFNENQDAFVLLDSETITADSVYEKGQVVMTRENSDNMTNLGLPVYLANSYKSYTYDWLTADTANQTITVNDIPVATNPNTFVKIFSQDTVIAQSDTSSNIWVTAGNGTTNINNQTIHAYYGFQDSSTVINISETDTYYQITNSSDSLFIYSHLDGVNYLSGDTIEFATAGHYHIEVSLSFSGLNNEIWKICGHLNGVPSGFSVKRYTGTSDVVNANWVGHVIAESGDKFTLNIANTTDTDNCTIINCAVIINLIKKTY